MKQLTILGLLILAIGAVSVNAAPPELQTPSPVIYLADNLDEQDKLGWCIDTLGRGLSEELQTHSCKPQGGDVQFAFNTDSQQIYSVEYAGKCATLNQPAAVGVTFDLLDCSDSELQKFSYNSERMEFSPRTNSDLCITAGAESRSAGPFMSRDLKLEVCAATEASFKQWIIAE